jgi:type I restriction enzyme M protein
MLEGIIALPDQLFYNTGIFTYIWIVTNKKESSRKGKVQLINAVSFYEKMKTSLGQKRKYITDRQIEEIVDLYQRFIQQKDLSIIVKNKDLGYTRITVEKPLKRNFKVSDERLEKLKHESAFQKLSEYPTKPKEPTKAAVIKILNTVDSIKTFKDLQEFSTAVKKVFSNANFRLSPGLQKAIENALSELDETANPSFDDNNRIIPDPELRDYENVPLNEDIESYFSRQVKPYAAESWIDTSKNQIGYEIPFTRFFYKYRPLRSIEEIDAEIKELENEILAGVRELTK